MDLYSTANALPTEAAVSYSVNGHHRFASYAPDGKITRCVLYATDVPISIRKVARLFAPCVAPNGTLKAVLQALTN